MISVIEYPKYNFFLFPGWLFTFEYYFETYSNKIINLMVEQLTKNQAWRFVWSEVCWLDKWWEKASQSQKDSFKRFKGFFFVFYYVYVGFHLSYPRVTIQGVSQFIEKHCGISPLASEDGRVSSTHYFANSMRV